MWGYSETGESGFQFCNLTEINGAKATTPEIFYQQCKAAAILGTIQATYTNFKFVSETTKTITEREALIGVGITGWMNNPDILFNEDIMKKGAEIVKYWNKIAAAQLGINQAARTTCVKPSGNASVLLGCASGIHGEHAPRYFRRMQMNKEGEIAKLFMEKFPHMCENSVWSDLDTTIAFPVSTNEGAQYKSDLLGVKQLEYVKKAQNGWVEHGTNKELCVEPWLRHNVSNTITVDDWDEVTQYVYDNRKDFCGISFLAAAGDRAYVQAPFAEVLTVDQIIDLYGQKALFTSALIEAGLLAFNEDLWNACATALGSGEELTDNHAHLLKRDFVRRFHKFADEFNLPEECADCLKDVYNLHKWWKIEQENAQVDWEKTLTQKTYTDINTMGAQACAGGVCDITF
jgi:ribonucleoside-diphosphate reductase alpha chain